MAQLSGLAARRIPMARRLETFTPYSFRSDASVPAFDASQPLIVFDGVCVLCSGFAQFVMRHDKEGRFQLTMAQSPLGQALYRHYRLDAREFETNLLIQDGRALGKMEGSALILSQFGWPWRLAAGVQFLPPRLADWLYDKVARNRYRLFGKTETCMLPAPEWRGRIID